MALYQGARALPGFLARSGVLARPATPSVEPRLRRIHVVERPTAPTRPRPTAPGRRAWDPARRRDQAGPRVLDRRPAGESVPRRRARARVRAGRHGGRLALLLGGIVIAFLLAFFSLAQTVRVTATDYEANRLLAEGAQLQAQRQELLSDLNRLGREPAVRKQAIDLGLFPLAEPVVVRAR
jgi:hypothetical protein